MYYTKIDREQCIACGLCTLIAPDIYEYDDNGIADTKKDNNTGIYPLAEEDILPFKNAYKSCPTGAIMRSDTPFS